MDDADGKLDQLAKLLKLNSGDDLQGTLTAQALLANQSASESMKMQARQNQAAINAYWQSQCGENYEPPEEEMGSNFVNCSIVSDQAISKLAQIIGDGGEQPTDPPTQPPVQLPVEPPATKPWWQIVAATLAAVLLGAVLVWLSWRAFGGQDRYELIAEPFEPPELLDIKR